MSAYYNEIDPYAAQWLRNLIAAGHIAPGDVDERSIAEVRPDDLRGYWQCHFFAGVGVWSYALRRAGWPDDREVWTGSCPCQPFSAAGKQEGTEDARHLWPEWFRLIRECRPGVVFGEQVSAAIRHGWLDLVSADMEGLDYAIGAAVVGAHSVGAPHIRQRLYFVADADADAGSERMEYASDSTVHQWQARNTRPRHRSGGQDGSELADADGRDASAEGLQRSGEHGLEQEDGGASGGMGNAARAARERDTGEVPATQARFNGERLAVDGRVPIGLGDAGSSLGAWSACDWLPCIDGKARPVEPGTFPLAHGAPARVGRLRAYGNAVVAPQAAEFIRSYSEAHQ